MSEIPTLTLNVAERRALLGLTARFKAPVTIGRIDHATLLVRRNDSAMACWTIDAVGKVTRL